MDPLDCSRLNQEVAAAAQDESARKAFIQSNENFILKCAGLFTRRYIDKSEDEWSIALIAFSSAIDSFSEERGNFYAYAKLLIRSRLTDYYRSQSRFASEISTDPIAFSEPPDTQDPQLAFRLQITKKTTVEPARSIQDEIIAMTDILQTYHFTFSDLAACSPKKKKTKAACETVLAFLLSQPVLVQKMQKEKLLPIKIICENTKVPRKVLEHHRKYIIAAVEIVNGDFPGLAEYINAGRKEENR